MQTFWKLVILLAGAGAIITGQVHLGIAFFALGVAVVVLIRPAEIVSEQPEESTSDTKQLAAVGYGGLLLVASLAAIAFIVSSIVPKG